MKIKLDEIDRQMYAEIEEGKVYLRYHEVTEGDPIGLVIPYGYPRGIKENSGVIAVYEKCIEKGITWQELIGYSEPDDILY